MNLNDPWVRAIHESTACLRFHNQPLEVGRRSYYGDNNGEGATPFVSRIQSLDMSLDYLNILEDQLVVVVTNNNSSNESEDDAWSRPPNRTPFEWTRFAELYPMDSRHAMHEAARGGSGLDLSSLNGNVDNNDDDDDAGDVPNTNFGVDDAMDCRRLYIRILTCQSEIFASKANLCASRDRREFQQGATELQSALAKIHQALKVADSQISKWWTRVENLQLNHHHHQLSSTAAQTREKDALVEDANIVEVAIQNMTQRREKLLNLCYQEQNWLLRKLEPEWEQRDAVKERIGMDRWKNNPNPKYDYAQRRREYEGRLRDVRQALEALQALDTNAAMAKANKLQHQIHHGITPENDNDVGTELPDDEVAMHNRRYNGLRPTPEWQARRVTVHQYPDPTVFGWAFTGSWLAAEFFEKAVVEESREYVIKLDWYFTTGTVKTALDHPTQGKTQLFGKQVTPNEYKKILQNPRVHTGNRYQQRQRGGRGRGRGRGRRGGRQNNHRNGGQGDRRQTRNGFENEGSAILRPSQVPST